VPDPVIVNPIEVVVAPSIAEIVVATNVLVDCSGGTEAGNVVASRAFTYDDVNILPIGTISGRILRVLVVIDTAFNGVSASLSVGDTGNTVRLQNTTENLPSSAGVYWSMPNYVYNSGTTVNLYITPGSSSAGIGIVYLLRN